MVLILLLTLLLSVPAYATNWCADAVSCFLMEDSEAESNRATGATDSLTISSGDTIEQSSTKKFGTYSRDFEFGDGDFMYQADGLSTDISGADQEISIVLWARFESMDRTSLVNKGWWDDDNQYLIRYDTEGIEFRLDSNGGEGGENCDTGDINLTALNTWYHIAATYDDANMYIYVDGIEKKSCAYSFGIGDASKEFMIGAYTYDSPARFMDGLIDDVGIFDTYLSITDINDIMDNGLYEAAASTRRIMVIQ